MSSSRGLVPSSPLPYRVSPGTRSESESETEYASRASAGGTRLTLSLQRPRGAAVAAKKALKKQLEKRKRQPSFQSQFLSSSDDQSRASGESSDPLIEFPLPEWWDVASHGSSENKTSLATPASPSRKGKGKKQKKMQRRADKENDGAHDNDNDNNSNNVFRVEYMAWAGSKSMNLSSLRRRTCCRALAPSLDVDLSPPKTQMPPRPTSVATAAADEEKQISPDSWPGRWYRGSLFSGQDPVGHLSAALVPRSSEVNFHKLCGKYGRDVRDMADECFHRQTRKCVDDSYERVEIGEEGHSTSETGALAPVLFIESVYIKKEFRKRSLGRALVLGLLDGLKGKFSVAVLYPCPLRSEGIALFSKLHLGASKLWMHWQTTAGFTPVSGTRCLAMRADTFNYEALSSKLVSATVSTSYPLSIIDTVRVVRTEGTSGFRTIERLIANSERTKNHLHTFCSLAAKISASESEKHLSAYIQSVAKVRIHMASDISKGDVVTDPWGYLGMVKEFDAAKGAVKISWGKDWATEEYPLPPFHDSDSMRICKIPRDLVPFKFMTSALVKTYCADQGESLLWSPRPRSSRAVESALNKYNRWLWDQTAASS